MAVNKTIDIKVNNNFEQSAEDLNDLNKGLKDTAKETEKVEESSKGATTAFDSMTSGSIGKFTALTTTIGGVVKSLFTLRGAIIATGLGALLVLITSITQAFKGSEEGQNKFAKLMKVLGTIFENILDLFADFGEFIINAFENPIESVKKLAKAIKDNIVNRLVGLLELLPALGSAIKKVFSGDFSEAAKIAINAAAKVTLGVENFTDKVEKATEATAAFIKEQQREARLAGQVADKRATADKVERKLLVDRAKLESTIAELKLKSRQEEEVSAEERKQALLDAQELEDQLLAKEEKALKLRLSAVQLENTLARSNKEALDAEAQAEAALLNIKTRRTDAARSTQRELNRVNKEIARDAKERAKVEEAALIYGVEFTQQTSNEEIVILTEAAKAKYDLTVKEGQERIKLQDAQDKLRIDLMDDGFDKELAKLVAESEARLAIAKDDKDLQLEIEEDFQKKLKELEEKTSKEIKDKKIKDAKTTADAEKKIQDAQIANVEAGISLVKNLAGENKKVQAAALIAENAVGIAKTIINTQAANAAALATPQAILTSGAAAAPVIAANNIAAGISIAASVAATAQGLSALKSGGSPTTAGQLPEGGGGTQAPSFNVVGDSGVNQLAELQQQPTQAFVVSGEVTTAQALDRNRVQNATL